MTAETTWLDKVVEEAIEPDLPIIDAHHHYWDFDNGRYKYDPYMLQDLVSEFGGHNVRQTVFVECDAMYRESGPDEFKVVGEVEFVQGLAAQSASGRYGPCRAASVIVGSADLTLGNRVVPVLEALIAASPNRFRGIRHRTAWADKDVIELPANWRKELMLDADFRQGFARLREYGLAFDAFLFHPQLPELTDLARAFPDTTIVLNHLATPVGIGKYAGKRDEVFAEWRSLIDDVASCQNVVMKLGGIGMHLNGFGWDQRDSPPTSDEMVEVNRDWFLYAIEKFGPKRCMFESNFPVDKESSSYVVLWNHFKKLTAGFRADERAAMFHDTALRVYRMPLH